MKLEWEFVNQTLFGGIDGPREQYGNCYPACLATLLGLKLEEVPHIYQTCLGDDDEKHREWNSWLRTKGIVALCWRWEHLDEFMKNTLGGSVAIFGGKSPRFQSTQHAVVGRLEKTGWTLIHDPHPSRLGIDGCPETVEFLIPTDISKWDQTDRF